MAAGSELLPVDAEIVPSFLQGVNKLLANVFQKLLGKYHNGNSQYQALNGDLERVSRKFCSYYSYLFFFLSPCF
jgi:hypothetical protein